MAVPGFQAELVIADLQQRYSSIATSPTLGRMYSEDVTLGHVFAVLHQQLNKHFVDINDRALNGRHYWAQNSRDLISLIAEVRQDLHDLRRAGVHFDLDARYQEALERCEPWLTSSGGSLVPEDFPPIDVLGFEPVFIPSGDVRLAKQREPVPTVMVGEGAYAIVSYFVDPDYDIRVATKRIKKTATSREVERFRREFDVMKGLSFPYVLTVFTYDESRHEYRMEYCEDTLRKYVDRRNNNLRLASRKRIALQLLYGLNYIHDCRLLHRDLSLQNVLLKVYASGAVLVKLSDFGLVKEEGSDFTKTGSEMKGTIRDPQLHNFKDYGLPNEIYAIGWLLSFIFTGRSAPGPPEANPVSRIVHRCIAPELTARYPTVLDIIADVELLDAPPKAVGPQNRQETA